MKKHKYTRLKQALLFSGIFSLLPSLQAQTFEAEDYSAFSDTTLGNTGGAYRSDDVDIEASSDQNGGFNVGWIAVNEWLSYQNLNITQAGTYRISLRVASPNGGLATVDLDAGSQTLADFTIPNTGGWQNWQTITADVNLTVGVFDLRVFSKSSGWNFNWIKVEALEQPDSLVFQAEDYTAFNDLSTGNTGAAYRTDDVDIGATTDTGGGFNVGWIEAGEWLSYDNVNITTTGNYQIKMRVASTTGGQANIDLNGGNIALGSIAIPNTGGWQNWQTVTLETHLTSGEYSLGVFAASSDWNFNWIEIVPGGEGPQEPNLAWSDEFNTIDTSVWNLEVGGSGNGNNELQWYSNGSNIGIEFDAQANSNVLFIEARQEEGGACWHGGNCGYTSGKITTQHKKSFKYGRLEARMKLPREQGIWPAFWMLGDNFNTQGWPQGGEIDIMEHVNTNNVTSGALHGPGYSGNTPINGHLVHNNSIDQDYHVYAIEWDANGITWFVDNTQFYSVTKAEVEQFGEYVYDQPFWFLFNLAVGGNWPGDPDHANFTTQRMYIDYIRVYQD